MTRKKRDYGRRRASKKPRARVCILTEGTVTEPEYIGALAEHFGLAKGLVKVIADKHTDPKGLVEAAYRHKSKNDRDCRDQKDVKVDSWWVVSDLESVAETARWENAKEAVSKVNSPNAEGIHLVFDSPSIEYWFILHYEMTSRDFDTPKSAVSYLKKYIPEYSKEAGSQTWDGLIAKTDIAVQRAERIRTDRRKTGSERPVADFDLLVKELRRIAGK